MATVVENNQQYEVHGEQQGSITPQVSLQVKIQESLLDDLSQAIVILSSRLTEITRETPSRNDTAISAPKEVLVQLAGRLRDNNCVLRDAITSITSILTSIEL